MLLDGRPADLADLRVGDVDLDTAGVTVMSKGRRQRWMPIGYTVVEATWEYLQARAQTSPLTDRLWVQTRHPSAVLPGGPTWTAGRPGPRPQQGKARGKW